MAVDNNSFFQYNETRAVSGYRSAWLVKKSTDAKYHLVGATETVPYVFGDKETFEYDLLQSPTKGQVEGKMSLESQDIEVLHHRDNAYRFGKLKDEGILDFMVINAEFVGYKFTGTIDYKPNNAEADVNRATVTITPMSASVTPILNARDDIQETLFFKNAIPATVKVSDKIDFTTQVATAAFNVKSIDANGAESSTTTSDVTTTDATVTFLKKGLYVITASMSDNSYAPWSTTVYVE